MRLTFLTRDKPNIQLLFGIRPIGQPDFILQKSFIIRRPHNVLKICKKKKCYITFYDHLKRKISKNFDGSKYLFTDKFIKKFFFVCNGGTMEVIWFY